MATTVSIRVHGRFLVSVHSFPRLLIAAVCPFFFLVLFIFSLCFDLISVHKAEQRLHARTDTSTLFLGLRETQYSLVDLLFFFFAYLLACLLARCLIELAAVRWAAKANARVSSPSHVHTFCCCTSCLYCCFRFFFHSNYFDTFHLVTQCSSSALLLNGGKGIELES